MVYFLRAPSNALNNFVSCASNTGKLIEALEGNRLFKKGLVMGFKLDYLFPICCFVFDASTGAQRWCHTTEVLTWMDAFLPLIVLIR
jgi:hypothetical protein